MNARTGLTLKARLMGLLLIVVIIICAFGMMAAINQKHSMLQDREDKVRNLVEGAVGIVGHFEALAQSGKMPEAQAKAEAAAILNSLRYDGKEYYFAYDRDWIYVVHGVKPAMIGKPIHGIKEGSGQDLGALFEANVNAGGGKGFTEYVWDKPGFDTPQPKISYLQTTPVWQWKVGTGIYLDDVDAAFRRELLILGSGMAVAIVLLMILGGIVLKTVLGQLGADPLETVAVVKRIAAGELAEPVPVRAGDRDSLMAAVSDMQQQLQRLVREIMDGANHLSQMSAHVTSQADAVGQGSEKQSEAATSMAASIEELTVSVNHISDRSQDARNLAEESGSLSQAGGQVIASAVAEMQRINESVDQAAATIGNLVEKTQTISSIMQVIKDIADQTNLLALNAAIEAARAGEMGRGFAVVADEVRKLSERTAQATQEIAVMIRDVQQGSEDSRHSMEQAVERVRTGLELAERGGEEIGRIQDSAKGVIGVVGDITYALQEQSVASQDIAQHVERIAQSASSNAAASTSASQQIKEMHRLADNLRQLVSRFRVDR
nr:methyl-accepting chemotaxis protein [Chromobacterium sp. ASV5]